LSHIHDDTAHTEQATAIIPATNDAIAASVDEGLLLSWVTLHKGGTTRVSMIRDKQARAVPAVHARMPRSQLRALTSVCTGTAQL